MRGYHVCKDIWEASQHENGNYAHLFLVATVIDNKQENDWPCLLPMFAVYFMNQHIENSLERGSVDLWHN